jgi:hypothetical protein
MFSAVPDLRENRSAMVRGWRLWAGALGRAARMDDGRQPARKNGTGRRVGKDDGQPLLLRPDI